MTDSNPTKSLLRAGQGSPAPPQKDWWRPLWRSQLFDPVGSHRQRLGSAVWLYLYLILHIDTRTNETSRTLSQLAREMNVPKKTARDWLARLRKSGYIGCQREGTLFHLQLIHSYQTPLSHRAHYSTLWRPNPGVRTTNYRSPTQ